MLVGIGDAVVTGVGPAELFGYLAISASGIIVAAIVASAPATFDLRVFRLGGVYVVAFEVTMLIGTPSVFGEHRDDPSGSMFLFSVCAAYVATTFAIAAAGARDSPRDRRDALVHAATRVPESAIDRTANVLSMIGVLVFIVYVSLTPVIPLFEAFEGSRATELAQAREQALTQLRLPLLSYLFGAARDVILPAAAATCLYQLLHRPTGWRFARFCVVGIVALLAAALTIEKSPVGRLIVVLFLTTWIGSSRVLRWRTVGAVVILFVAFPFAVSRLSNSPLNSNAQIASTVGERMLRVPANVHYHYIAYVDSDIDQFLVGRTLPNLGKFSPGPDVTITEEVQRRIFPDAVVEGNANGSYISNFYVDFGVIGLLLGSLVTGLLIGALDWINRRALPRPLGVALQAVTAVQLLFLTSSSLFDTIAQFPFGNLGLLAIIVLFVYVWVPLRRPVSYRGGPKAAANAAM